VDSSARPLLVYDGQCGFCTRSVQTLMTGLPRTTTAVAVPWQSLPEPVLGRLGLSRRDVHRAAWWIDESSRRWRGHEAVAQALIASGGWRRQIGRAMLSPLLGCVAAGVYAVVARYRRYLFAPPSTACAPEREQAEP
jgi:predicted DCC family thiol-disulfide oxidoreductase YuxK